MPQSLRRTWIALAVAAVVVLAGMVVVGRDAVRDLAGAPAEMMASRLLSARHLPGLVVLGAIGALVVAYFRSRLAVAYAPHMFAWTEGQLTPAGRVESDTGSVLATLDSSMTGTRRAWPIHVGRVLVAPAALETTTLYRAMPVITRSQIVQGTHAHWEAGTMLRLRDARALVAVSAACAGLAMLGHYFAA